MKNKQILKYKEIRKNKFLEVLWFWYLKREVARVYLKAHSHDMHLICAAAAESCNVENYKISYCCRNVTVCSTHMGKHSSSE